MLWKIPLLNWVVEKFFSANNSSGNSRGENDRGYHTDLWFNPAVIYLLKGINWNSRTRCKIRLKLTIKTLERRQWRRCAVLIVTLNIFYTFLHLHFTYFNFGHVIAKSVIAKFTGKHLCPSFLKRNSDTDVFCKFCGIFNNVFFVERLGWLLLYWHRMKIDHLTL